MPHYRTLLATALATLPALGLSQESLPTPSTADACTLITIDSARLACYDKALGHTPIDTKMADAMAQAAALALAQENAEKQTAIDKNNPPHELFEHDEPYSSLIANAGKGSLLDSRWELAKDSKLGLFQLRAHRPIYVLPFFWTSDVNETPYSPTPKNNVTVPTPLDPIEAKLQLSFKTKIAENILGDNGDIWFGYTQSSRWQVYNGEISRPFRETNYEPEITLMFRNNYHIGGWNGRMWGLTLNHQSNGRSDPHSRSWNRIILNVGLDRERWALLLQPWYRLPESRSDNNNPDISDYTGRGSATIIYHHNGHDISMMLRHSLKGGSKSHGAAQFDWGFPIHGMLRGHLQIFSGYGESMIDYNHKATYVGLGISLMEWF